MKKIICFGDSNTYGYDPRSWYGGRYAPESRWVDILANETGWTICNMGENGREIPTSAPIFSEGADLVIVMLGTNDILQGRSLDGIIVKLQHFLTSILTSKKEVLLIAPPPLTFGEWVSDPQLIRISRDFAQSCQSLAGQLGVAFADAGAWSIPLAHDGVHFTPQGHSAFAAGLLAALQSYSDPGLSYVTISRNR